MFSLYFNQYLSDINVAINADNDDIASLPYPEYIDKLVERGNFTRTEAEAYAAGFIEAYGLGGGAMDAVNAGDVAKIVPVFLNFDESGAIEADLKAYQKDNRLTDAQMEELWKNGGILRVIPEYVHSDPGYYNRFVALTVESIARFISDRIVLRKARHMDSYSFSRLAYQELKGAHRIFLGFSGSEESLLAAASRYANREFAEMNDKAYDCLCELINTINGLYASELSKERVHLEIGLPGHQKGKTISSNGTLYCLPVSFGGAEMDVVFSFDAELQIG